MIFSHYHTEDFSKYVECAKTIQSRHWQNKFRYNLPNTVVLLWTSKEVLSQPTSALHVFFLFRIQKYGVSTAAKTWCGFSEIWSRWTILYRAFYTRRHRNQGRFYSQEFWTNTDFLSAKKRTISSQVFPSLNWTVSYEKLRLPVLLWTASKQRHINTRVGTNA